MQVLLIAAALAIHASASDRWHAPLLPRLDPAASPAWPALIAAGIALLPALLAWLLAHAFCIGAVRAMARRGDARAAWRAERATALARSFTCLWLGASALALGWVPLAAEVLNGLGLWSAPALWACEIAAIGTLAALLAASFWSFAPVDRRLREAMLLRQLDRGEPVWEIPTRSAYTLARVRDAVLMLLIPVAVLVTLGRVIDSLADAIVQAAVAGRSWAAWLPAWAVHEGSVLHLANLLHALGLLVALALMPVLQRRIWDTIPLGSGPLRDSIEALCAGSRTRLRRILVWRTRGLSVNAAVLGALPRFRYLIFTDALLESMPADQVRAVAAHEIGHLRHHHVAWLVVGLGAVLVLTSELGARAAEAAGLGESGLAMAGLLAALVIGLPVMGIISRRFEWQADAYAARILSPSESRGSTLIDPAAARSVSDALTSAARLNGVAASAPSWRHGSIALRRRRVQALIGRDAARLPIDRVAHLVKIALLACWAGVGLLAVW